jgi:Uma2 family endonuclease
MNAAVKLALVPAEEYLASELNSPVKREYVAGAVYAMTGGTTNHSRIAGNVFSWLHNALGSGTCEVFGSDMKVRIQLDEEHCFYYPDVLIACEVNSGDELFQDRPTLIVEVLSPSTRRIDDGEKKDHYLSIPSLQNYLLVDQDSPSVVLYRRGKSGFSREIVSGLESVVELSHPQFKLPLAEVYRRVSFAAE